jgi:hypothetical protein
MNLGVNAKRLASSSTKRMSRRRLLSMWVLLLRRRPLRSRQMLYREVLVYEAALVTDMDLKAV